MTRMSAYALCLTSLLAVSACVPELGGMSGGSGGTTVRAGSEAGGAEACRQHVAGSRGVAAEQAQVAALGRDAQGFASYRVTAGGRTETCTVDANNVVLLI